MTTTDAQPQDDESPEFVAFLLADIGPRDDEENSRLQTAFGMGVLYGRLQSARRMKAAVARAADGRRRARTSATEALMARAAQRHHDIAAHFHAQPASLPKMARLTATAKSFKVSVNTVRNALARCQHAEEAAQ